MNWILIALASFFGAVLSALGMGGGGILLIYLTAYVGMQQQTAQGINLVFFIPVAIVAVCIHAKHKLLRWKVVLPCILVGLAGVWLGSRRTGARIPAAGQAVRRLPADHRNPGAVDQTGQKGKEKGRRREIKV